jgi:hypothetical protein
MKEMTKLFEWIIPVRTVSEANSREHWAKKKRRTDVQKRWVKLYFDRYEPDIRLPCTIKLTRIGRRELDSDNLPVSMKYIRDAIADRIFPRLAPGQADNDKRLSWEYGQEISRIYAVKVEFFAQEAVA